MLRALKLFSENVFSFKGRTSRADYWWVILVWFILWFATVIIDPSLLLWLLYNIVAAVPVFALTVRRLHDTDRSGLRMFFLCIPLVGLFILLIYLVAVGTPGENKYGYNTSSTNTKRELQGYMEICIRNWKNANPDVNIPETELLPAASWIIDYATNNHIEDENVRKIEELYREIRVKREW